MELPDAYPLQWPDGWVRTKVPKNSRYARTGKLTEGRVRKELLEAIRKLGGTLPIISSNVELRRDGLPYANRPIPEDGGIAVYWVREGKQEVMACDRWKRPWENMRAIFHAIEGLRAMERAGASQILERAFQAFQLPAEVGEGWRKVYNIEPGFTPSEDYMKRLFRQKAAEHHPDHGGDEEEFKRYQRAYEEAVREIRGEVFG